MWHSSMRRWAQSAAAAAALAAAPAVAQGVNIATYKGADRQNLLIDGAKKEGKVVFYSGMIVDQALLPVSKGFKAKYPFVDLQFWRGTSRDIILKVITEAKAGRPEADVFESSGVAEPTMKQGVVQQYWSPELSALPAAYVDPNGWWSAYRVNYFGLAYNSSRVPTAQVPKTHDDLLDPKWKGRMAWHAESESGANLFIANVLLARGKDATANYLEKLSKQDIANFHGSARALVDKVGEGEYDLGIEIFAHHPLISKAIGAPLDAQMLSPVSSTFGTMMLVKNAPHVHSAMLLIDYLQSKEGQEILRKADYLSARPDVEADAKLQKIIPERNGLKEQVFTPARLFETRDDANRLFSQYFKE